MLGERVLGGLSREEARLQQTLKYKEDSKKFAEKEKEVYIIESTCFRLRLNEFEKCNILESSKEERRTVETV